MARFNLYLISAILLMVLAGLFFTGWWYGKKQYEQGMTDMHSLCYDIGPATIQSKVTGKIIVCDALTTQPTL